MVEVTVEDLQGSWPPIGNLSGSLASLLNMLKKKKMNRDAIHSQDKASVI